MSITPEPAPAPELPPSEAPPKRRRGKIILIVIAGVIGLIALLGVAAFVLVNQSTEDAQKVSDQLVTAVQQGDGAAAYALTGPAFREATAEPELTELVKGLSTLVTKKETSPKSKSINVSTDTGKIAVFVYTMDGTGGKPVYFKTQIREEDGQWKVMSFRSSESQLTTEVE